MTRMWNLVHDEARRRCADAAMTAPHGAVMRLGLPGKTNPQNNMAHSIYEDFARHALLDGERADSDAWKSRLKVLFYDETGNDPEYADDWRGIAPTLTPIPGTRYVLMPEIRSALFPGRLYRAYIEFLYAKGAEHGVTWSPTSIGKTETETA